MNILLRNATIIDPGNSFHLQCKDLLFKEGILAEIGDHLLAEGAQIWEGNALFVSPGWLDIGAYTMDPGFEHREDLLSFCQAAVAGGYTAVAVFPNTDPFVHSKGEVLYLKGHSKSLPVRILPIGAISRDGAGEDIAEIYDMHMAGAVAYSDGSNPVQKSGLLLRALQYVKAIDGLVIDQPLDLSLASKGQIHEGPVSTALGMRGIPSLAESSQVYRNIQLLRYAESKLLLHAISSEESMDMIQAARQEGLQLGVTVPAMNLVFTDHELDTFDTQFKVMPPLRSERDLKALRTGLANNSIDAIVSNHLPLEEDQKDVEFPYAGFGASGLETTFALTHTHLVPGTLSLTQLITKLSHHPRQALGLAPVPLQVGSLANVTVFQPDKSWTFNVQSQFSKGRNNPLDGKILKGKVFGTILGTTHFRNELS
ncbi:MAG: dihydroorotase [Saprospiraceae bacterium]|nr:dihydroorotase [Saprospiraceae bacterium]